MWKIASIITLALLVVGCKQTEQTLHENGAVYQVFYHDDQGEFDGPFKSYSDDGALFEEATYSHGKLVGTRTIYYASGAREIVESYLDGVIDGTYQKYYESGQLQLEATYTAGVMNGTLKTYHENGEIHEVVTMADNEEHGPFKEYHPNGKLQWQGTYHHGENEIGLVQEYDTTGTLIRKMMCDDRSVCQTIWTITEGDVTPQPLENLING